MGIYMWIEWHTPITTAGIYHNSDLWLISLSDDWTNWLTIADKNLWATSTDITSENSYGNYFQRGNNYPFPTTWTVTTSNTRVNAQDYWPWNYYNSSTFITGTSWDSSYNNNLWGWVTDTNIAKRWPCDEWWHIPSLSEVQDLADKLNSVVWRKRQSEFEQYLFMWNAKSRNTNGNISDISAWMFRTATHYSNTYANILFFNTTTQSTPNRAKCTGFVIRPFKNEAVQPDSSRTVIYQ